MYQFIETVKIENGIIRNPDLHQGRINYTMKAFYPKSTIHINELNIPDNHQSGIFKLRIVYSDKIQYIEFLPYKKKMVRSLKIVNSDNIDYNYKYLDRSKIEELFSKRENCDDVIIIQNGLATDSSYSNLVFYDGCKHFTPMSPLLNGTKRQQLISQGSIIPIDIKAENFHNYQSVSLINCMIELEEVEIDIRNIV